MNYSEFKKQVENLQFKSKSDAKKKTGLSYLMGFNSSSKVKKGEKENYWTGILYLAPSMLSGFNTCPKASKGCIAGCLNTSGQAIMNKGIVPSRIKKTWLFYANRQFFLDWLHSEIESGQKQAKNKGMNYAVRLNGTSDLDISLFKVLDKFKCVTFYDYTKVFKRLEKFSRYNNYHLTFSYSENNHNEWKKAIKQRYNVAVPFVGKELPKKWSGYQVFDADVTDLRFLDKPVGAIAGLRVKRIKDKVKQLESINAGFVVDPSKN